MPEPVAIIGMSGRFPGAPDLPGFKEMLMGGKNAIGLVPADRWDMDLHFHPDPDQAVALQKSYCKWGAFLEHFDRFDPLFFNMTPRDAENTDPQERIFLETCWKAFEDAGYAPETLSPEVRKNTGVFAGITRPGFNLYQNASLSQFPSTSFAALANRVSFHLDLQGPSMPVDTMCSSALAAIHQACEYLLRQGGKMAVAGAVNLYLHPSGYAELCRNQMLADSPCRVLSARTDAGSFRVKAWLPWSSNPCPRP